MHTEETKMKKIISILLPGGLNMFDKYIYNFLMFVNHWSTYLTSWSWIKLYKNRKEGYAYKKRKR